MLLSEGLAVFPCLKMIHIVRFLTVKMSILIQNKIVRIMMLTKIR